MLEIKLNHDAVKMYDSFMLSENQGKRIDSIIAFESIVADNIVEKDYDGESSRAPRVLRTKTGVMSRCMKHVQNEQEMAYLMFVFMGKHELAHKLLAMYTGLSKAMSQNTDEIVQKAKDHFKDELAVDEIKERIEVMLEQTARPLRPLKKLIRQIENSNYDFALFKAMIDEEDGPDSYIADVIEDSIVALKHLKSSGLFKSSEDEDDDED